MYKTKSDAAAAGETHYFTGGPCRRGHIAARYVNNGTCVECHRGIYARHRDRILLERKERMTEAGREKGRAASRAYVEKNRDAIKIRRREQYHSDIEASRAKARERYGANPLPFKAGAKKRKHSKRQATPKWFSEFDSFAIEEAFDLCSRRLIATRSEWHVDHMIPLSSRTACGLHCAHNIQVIPASLNMAKHNKMALTLPFEWLHATAKSILGHDMVGDAREILCVDSGRVFACAGDVIEWLRANGWSRAMKSAISKALSGQYKMAYGHIWRYAEKSPE